DAESKRVRDAYRPFVAHMLRLMGRKDHESAADTILALETRLAQPPTTKADRRDADKTYHKQTQRDLAKLAPEIDRKQYFARISAKDPKAVIAMQPEFLAEVSKVLADTPVEDLKTYLSFHLVNSYAGYLSSRFVRKSFSFYGLV